MTKFEERGKSLVKKPDEQKVSVQNFVVSSRKYQVNEEKLSQPIVQAGEKNSKKTEKIYYFK
jgi:hypothetical protein